MNEQNGHQIPFSLAFNSVFGNSLDLLATSNGNCGSHGLELSPWTLAYSQQTTHYDEASQYPVEGGCASVAGMQAVTEVTDFQGNLHVDMGSASLYLGQYENIENEGQTTCSNHTSRTQEVNGNCLHVIQSHPEPSKATSYFDSKISRKRSRQKLNARDCQRRSRIAKAIQDLEELLPQPARNQQEVIDNTVKYVEHLQLQLEELSQNRLGGETDTDALNFLKGFNLQLLPQLFLTCKEMFGRSLQENPAAAMELLESRGLLMMPMALVEVLCQMKK